MMNWKELPGNARVWVYQSDRELETEEVNFIRMKGSAFVTDWAAHGTALKATIEVFHHRFIVLFLDQNQAAASGCSIDKSVVFMQQLEKDHDIRLLDRMNIAWKNHGAIFSAPLAEFEKMLSRGEVDEHTIVFNNLVSTKAELENSWEVEVKNSWHRQLLSC